MSREATDGRSDQRKAIVAGVAAPLDQALALAVFLVFGAADFGDGHDDIGFGFVGKSGAHDARFTGLFHQLGFAGGNQDQALAYAIDGIFPQGVFHPWFGGCVLNYIRQRQFHCL